MLTTFDYQPRTRVLFGADAVTRIGELAAGLPARRVLLVTDAGIVAAGHAARVEELLRISGLEVVIFDRVQENPTTRCVRDCVEVARAGSIDAIIGLGGGSSLDTAKGCNFLLTNGGEMKDYWGVGKASQPMLPLIAIPTTAGTGSECQSFAVISDEITHQKMACGDPKAVARVAILDPKLTVSQPPGVTACTGIDAIAHALESAVTKKRTPVSALFSREAFKLGLRAFPRVLAEPQDIAARGEMLLAAAWAGVAIENSMLGAAHSAANPLTAHFGIVHGQAVGLMLPHVVRFNALDSATERIYRELCSAASISHAMVPGEAIAAKVEELLDVARLPRGLTALGVGQDAIPTLAPEAASQWTARFNPRDVVAVDFEELYTAALFPKG